MPKPVQDTILPEVERRFMRSLMSADFEDDSMLALLKPGMRLAAERQLDIYRRNIVGAFQKVLAQVYPACFNILGESYFNQLCRAYRIDHPSTDPDLNRYGDNFPEFLSEHIHESGIMNGFEYLPDLARLEWHWHASYFCRDDQAFDFQALGQLDNEQRAELVFYTSDSLYLLESAYPVIAIWQANRGEPQPDQEFEHDGSRVYLAIYRQQYEPQIKPLDADDYFCLQAIQSGLCMDELIERFASLPGERLPHFIQKGWICGFHTRDRQEGNEV